MVEASPDVALGAGNVAVGVSVDPPIVLVCSGGSDCDCCCRFVGVFERLRTSDGCLREKETRVVWNASCQPQSDFPSDSTLRVGSITTLLTLYTINDAPLCKHSGY